MADLTLAPTDRCIGDGLARIVENAGEANIATPGAKCHSAGYEEHAPMPDAPAHLPELRRNGLTARANAVLPAALAPVAALRILLLEDKPNDAELTSRELRKAGVEFTAMRVDTLGAFIEALETFIPDIVLADCKLTGFDGAEALAHVRLVHPDIPLIIVTDALGDEAAIKLLHGGAWDYVLKDNLARLPHAVGRALSFEQGTRARKAAEQATRESEAKFRSLVEQNIAGIAIVSESGAIAYVNPYFARLIGRAPAELIGRPLLDFVPADVRQVVLNQLSAQLSSDAPFVQHQSALQAKDDSRIEVLINATLTTFEGRPASIAVVIDISERKRAEEKSRENEAKFRSLVEQNVAGIFIVREDGAIGYVNPFFAKLLGYAATDLIGRPLLDIIPADRRADARLQLGGQLAGDRGFLQVSSAMQTRDGATVEVLLNASRSIFEGQPASLAVVLDVTERNNAQRKLTFNTAVLAAEQDVSPDGIIVVDSAARIISVNAHFAEIFRIPPQLIADQIDEPVLRWVADQIADPVAFLQRVQDLYAHTTETSREEIALKDGRVFDRHSAPLALTNGKYLGRIWFFRDVSASKETERTLRRLNRALRTLSAGGEALVRASNEAELLNETCRIIVEIGGYRMAWIGWADENTAQSVTPVAWGGQPGDYLDKAQINWADAPRGQGPTGRAIRTGKLQVAQNVGDDLSMAPWQAEAAKQGFGSTVALPLGDGTRIFAVLTIYAAASSAFDANELNLLQELAGDLAFGMRSLREHTAHEKLNQRWRASLEATVGAIAGTVELRDAYTAGHQRRVATLAVAIARVLSMSDNDVQGINLAGIIHDVGKIIVPAEILSKPGKLSRIEYQLIQGHAQAGYDIVKGVDFPWPIADMVYQHHERLDGSGYPQGLRGDAILPGARILAVADVVDAMMSHRPYRAALGIDAALAEIEKGKGQLFDPAAVDACVELFRHLGFNFNQAAPGTVGDTPVPPDHPVLNA